MQISRETGEWDTVSCPVTIREARIKIQLKALCDSGQLRGRTGHIMHAEFKTQTWKTNILRFLRNIRKILDMASSFRQHILVAARRCILNLCPNVRLGVTLSINIFITWTQTVSFYIPVFMFSPFWWFIQHREAAIGRGSISGILLVPVSPLVPELPGCLGALHMKDES